MSHRPHSASRRARFSGFEIDLHTGEVSRQGRRIRLPDKPFQVLVSLLERPGQLVTREELRQRLWSDDTFVDFDNNLNAMVSRLREALNDSARGPRFIETIPRKGYRFVGPPPVWEGEDPAGGSSPARRRWWSAVAGAAAIAAVATTALLLRLPGVGSREEPAPEAGRRMLAVLPFENLSDDPGQEFLADGLTEELLTRLGSAAPQRLGVIARTSVRRYKSSEKTIGEIGEELGVAYVVEGSVRVQGERLRIAAQLIRVSDQTHLWAESYDRGTSDLLEIQNDIAIQVTLAILPRLLPSDPEGPTERVDAFREYLEGLHHLARNDVEAARRAARHFEAATALDPGYARAWAALAKARSFTWFGAASPEEAEGISEQARAAGMTALELDPSLTEAYVALAFRRLYHRWDPDGALKALDPALEGPPSSAEAQRLAAAAYSATARHDEALGAVAEALILDPRSPSTETARGWYLLFAGRPADAEESCRVALDGSPEDPSAARCLYQALLRTGQGGEAVRVLGRLLMRTGVPRERFQDLDPQDPARAIPDLERIRLEQIFSRGADDPAAPFDAAVAFAALGETDRAFSALEGALEGRDSRLLYLNVDPRFDPLRQDPRFPKLLRRISPPG